MLEHYIHWVVEFRGICIRHGLSGRAKEEGAFFVKNLENIQGDERDVIFISVTYAKGSDRRLRYNFGPSMARTGGGA